MPVKAVTPIPLVGAKRSAGFLRRTPGSTGTLASRGLRGELLFGVPCVLSVCPRLLCYYRLVLGLSHTDPSSGAGCPRIKLNYGSAGWRLSV
ncbi:MAG: XcyI family restriction endonuclease [Actinobacteria bacterium]|nr:XcyI family restriction endonuclease [Actinomycetota bacterium]